VSTTAVPVGSAPPLPASETCPLCGSPLGTEQEWCLRCGAAARTRLASTPNWRTPLVALGLAIVLGLGVLTAALVKLAGGPSTIAPSTITRTVTTPAASTPTSTTPGATTPLGTTTTPDTTSPTPGTTSPTPSTTNSTPGTTNSAPGTLTPTTTLPGVTPGATPTPRTSTPGTTTGAATTTPRTATIPSILLPRRKP
jgi:hypothetical protein